MVHQGFAELRRGGEMFWRNFILTLDVLFWRSKERSLYG